MQTISQGYRGLSLLVELNLDRMLTAGALVLALVVGGLIAAA
jgi:hypothetical protein